MKLTHMGLFYLSRKSDKKYISNLVKKVFIHLRVNKPINQFIDFCA